jgi:hypothetical protein
MNIMEFSEIFPSHNPVVYDNDETAVLRFLACLPMEDVSTGFLQEFLGSVPLKKTLRALAGKGAILMDIDMRHCMLSWSTRSDLGEDCRPRIEDAAPLMAFITEN